MATYTEEISAYKKAYLRMDVSLGSITKISFIGVMITSSARFNDEHSFLVFDAMFEQPLQ
jgi:hypothetical protein